MIQEDIMNKWDKLLEEFIGKDRVESLSIKQDLNTNKWLYKYRERIDGKLKTSVLEFNDRHNAEKFHFHFGGKNPSSCSAPLDYNKLGLWRSEDLRELGHRITEISLIGQYTVRDTVIEIALPPESGHDFLISKKKNKKGDIAKFVLNDIEKCHITRVFAGCEEFDNFIDFLQTNESLKKLVWHVRWMTLENEETNEVGNWRRCRAQDGTSRMILELKTVNGVNYQNIMYRTLLGYADGMADAECCKVGVGKKIQKESTVCYFAAKSGKFDK